MSFDRLSRLSFMALAALTLISSPSYAQQPPPVDPHAQHRPGAAEEPSLFATREASGTAWLPDQTPMFGSMRKRGPWTAMVHGNLFVQSLYEPGFIHRTGGFQETQTTSVNWGMVMVRRQAGAGRFGLRGMASLEPWTVPGCGYLNLLASGEICEGDTIHDRQHPHDLFMELAAEYERPLRGTLNWQLYGGLAGEPALGPVAFPHRLSAMSNPLAPMAHHWLDSTHITYGVVTTGIFDRKWKLEASLFNGREPDEARHDLDLAKMDSYSARFTLAPTPQLALQVSAGNLNEAEQGAGSLPSADVKRATASATYHRPRSNGTWATFFAWGVNRETEYSPCGAEIETTNAVLLETSIESDRHTWFGRGEVVQKSAHDLHAHEYEGEIFVVAKLGASYVRSFTPWKGLVPGIGGGVTLNFVPEKLALQYDGRVRPGFALFLNLRPARHTMAAADPHAGHTMPSAAPASDPHAAHQAPAAATEKQPEKQRDPVTGLMVDPAKAPTATYQGRTYYFSSEESKREFLANPAKFVKDPA
jgi:YHS domain-containing protein